MSKTSLVVLFMLLINSILSTRFDCQEKDRKPKMCTMDWKPVCGFTKENCNDNSCMKEFGNNCVACQRTEILFTELKNCPFSQEENK